MDIKYAGFPLVPRSWRIIENTAAHRVERYYEKKDYQGRYFDLTLDKDISGTIVPEGEIVGGSIGDIYKFN